MLHCWKLQFCLDIFSYFTALWSLYKKWCFQLKISSVNVTKIHSFLVTFTEEMLNGKLHFCALGVLVEIFLIYLLFQFRSKLEFFFAIWVFFHKHWEFTGQQGTIFIPLYHLHLLSNIQKFTCSSASKTTASYF